MKKIALALFAFGSIAVFGQSMLFGKIEDSLGPAFGATVKILKNGKIIAGASTDDAGNFSISVAPSEYSVEIDYIGFNKIRVENVVVLENEKCVLNQKFERQKNWQDDYGCILRSYKVPLIQLDNTSSGQTFSSDQIRNFAF